MAGGKGKLRPEDNPKPWKPGESGNPNGAPISFKKQIRELLDADGVMKIKWDNVTEVKDGEYVKVKLPKRDAVSMKLMQWAMSSNSTASLKSIQMIWEQLEGKPHQSTSVDFNTPVIQQNVTDDQVEKILKELKPKKGE